VTKLGVDNKGGFLAGDKDFSSNAHMASGAHKASYSVGIGR